MWTYILRALIEHGAGVSDADSAHQKTPLHRAANHNNVQEINVLVEAGTNIEARDCDRLTPLHDASMSLCLEALAVLLRHGARVNAQDL